jgi:hypothetical protein
MEERLPNAALMTINERSTCVKRSRGEPMKEVAGLVSRHVEGIVAWAQTRQTNGFLEAIQRPVPGRQTPRARLHASVHHPRPSSS